VLLREHRNERQHRDDLELRFLGFACDMIRKVMQTKIQDPEGDDEEQQKDGRADHQNVGLAGSGYEERQIAGCGRVKGFSHRFLLIGQASGRENAEARVSRRQSM
jgi:hypothetical protein